MQDELWPIFVISLPDAQVRRANIAQQLQACGLDFSFIDAIDGRKKLPPEWEPFVDRQAAFARDGYGISDGELACTLSHQLAYSKIIDQGLAGAVILEDDAVLTPDFVQFYRAASYRNGDFIQLYHWSVARVFRGTGRAISPKVRLHRLSYNAFCSVGYSVSFRGAAYLQRGSNPVSARADWPVECRKMRGKLAVPAIVLHPNDDLEASTLGLGRSGLIPEGFDFTAKYPKGWRRLISLSAWKRAIINRLSVEINDTGST